MITRELETTKIALSAVGMGCMGLSEFYGPAKEESEAIKLLHRAIDLGINHFDTAEIYGMGRNETLAGRAFRGRWDEIVLATKFGPQRDARSGAFIGVDGSPQNVQRSCEGSLRRLGAERIDLYYLHRVDPARPIEETVEAMAELVEQGKVRALGLSEASAETLRRAHAVHPIAALQSEYSIFSRDIEAVILPTCVELGISLVAYSPLGRGLLTGRYRSEADRPTDPTDFRGRSSSPRFQPGALAANLRLVDEVRAMSDAKNVLPAQVALAWVLAQGEHVLTIPGTTSIGNLETNASAVEVELSQEELETLSTLADEVQGERYDENGMAAVNR